MPIHSNGFTVSRVPGMEIKMDQEYTLPEAAKSIGATVDQLRYWISLMDIESTRRGKCRYLAEEAVSRLRGMANLVKGGTAPKEAAALAREQPTEAVVISAPVSEPPATINDFQRIMVLLAEENRQIKQTMSTILDEVKAVRSENAALRDQVNKVLLPPPLPATFHEPPKPVNVWNPPEPSPDPLEGAGIFTRTWVYLVQPEKLRRCAS